MSPYFVYPALHGIPPPMAILPSSQPNPPPALGDTPKEPILQSDSFHSEEKPLCKPKNSSENASNSERKVSVSSSASSPKRPRMTSGGGAPQATPPPKKWQNSPTTSLMDFGRNSQNNQRGFHHSRRTFYSSGYEPGPPPKRNYAAPSRGGFHRHSGGPHQSQQFNADKQRRQQH